MYHRPNSPPFWISSSSFSAYARRRSRKYFSGELILLVSTYALPVHLRSSTPYLLWARGLSSSPLGSIISSVYYILPTRLPSCITLPCPSCSASRIAFFHLASSPVIVALSPATALRLPNMAVASLLAIFLIARRSPHHQQPISATSIQFLLYRRSVATSSSLPQLPTSPFSSSVFPLAAFVHGTCLSTSIFISVQVFSSYFAPSLSVHSSALPRVTPSIRSPSSVLVDRLY